MYVVSVLFFCNKIKLFQFHDKDNIITSNYIHGCVHVYVEEVREDITTFCAIPRIEHDMSKGKGTRCFSLAHNGH